MSCDEVYVPQTRAQWAVFAAYVLIHLLAEKFAKKKDLCLLDMVLLPVVLLWALVVRSRSKPTDEQTKGPPK